MNKRLLHVLNLCTVLFLPLALLPLLVIYHAAVTELAYGGITQLPVGQLALQLFACELCGMAGRACELAADKLALSSVVRRILAVPAGAAAAGMLYFVFSWVNPIAAPGMAAFGAAAFWVVGGLRFYTYGDILCLRVFFGYLLEYAAVLVVMELFKINPAGAEAFAAALFFGLLLVLFGANQAGIDFMMQRRYHRFDALPQKIRSYNIRLFAITAAVLLALFLLYRPIAWGISWLGKGLLAVLRWLVGLLAGDGEQTESSAPQEQVQQGENPLGDLGSGESSPFWDYFFIVVALGILALIYCYRNEIRSALRSVWEKIKRLVQQLLWGGRQKADRDENEYYTETDEKIESDESDIQEDLSVADRRKWRRACRRFASMPDSPEAMRSGYRLILQGIALQGVPVAASDTTLEICHNAMQNGLPPIEKCTQDYNCLRYGEHEFDLGSRADIRAALGEIVRYKK